MTAIATILGLVCLAALIWYLAKVRKPGRLDSSADAPTYPLQLGSRRKDADKDFYKDFQHGISLVELDEEVSPNELLVWNEVPESEWSLAKAGIADFIARSAPETLRALHISPMNLMDVRINSELMKAKNVHGAFRAMSRNGNKIQEHALLYKPNMRSAAYLVGVWNLASFAVAQGHLVAIEESLKAQHVKLDALLQNIEDQRRARLSALAEHIQIYASTTEKTQTLSPAATNVLEQGILTLREILDELHSKIDREYKRPIQKDNAGTKDEYEDLIAQQNTLLSLLNQLDTCHLLLAAALYISARVADDPVKSVEVHQHIESFDDTTRGLVRRLIEAHEAKTHQAVKSLWNSEATLVKRNDALNAHQEQLSLQVEHFRTKSSERLNQLSFQRAWLEDDLHLRVEYLEGEIHKVFIPTKQRISE